MYVRSFKAAECDADHSLVVEKVRKSLGICKQADQKFDGERFNLRKLNELEVRKLNHIEISNRSEALEKTAVCIPLHTRHHVKTKHAMLPHYHIATYDNSHF
jgi:hypothetical protein